MLHYNPRHVSSSTILIFRRTNFITTASGIVTLCKRPYSMPVESGLNRYTVRPFTESDDTRCCNNTICPPEDEHSTARNMLRIIMYIVYNTRVRTLIVATIYLQLIQNRYMFRIFTVLQCSHQHCVQPVASDVEVVGYL